MIHFRNLNQTQAERMYQAAPNTSEAGRAALRKFILNPPKGKPVTTPRNPARNPDGTFAKRKIQVNLKRKPSKPESQEPQAQPKKPRKINVTMKRKPQAPVNYTRLTLPPYTITVQDGKIAFVSPAGLSTQWIDATPTTLDLVDEAFDGCLAARDKLRVMASMACSFLPKEGSCNTASGATERPCIASRLREALESKAPQAHPKPATWVPFHGVPSSPHDKITCEYKDGSFTYSPAYQVDWDGNPPTRWAYGDHRPKPTLDISSLKKDDKVMVSNGGEKWYRRYFLEAGCHGAVRTSSTGRTSWTGDQYQMYSEDWYYCRLPTPDEL